MSLTWLDPRGRRGEQVRVYTVENATTPVDAAVSPQRRLRAGVRHAQTPDDDSGPDV